MMRRRNKRVENRLREETWREKNPERGAVAEARPGRDGEDRKEVRGRTWEKMWGRTQ